MAKPEDLAEALTQSLAQSQKAFADIAGAFKNLRFQRSTPVKFGKFSGRPKKSGDQTLKEWLDDLDTYTRQLDLSADEKLNVAIDHLAGEAKEEIRCCPQEDKDSIDKLLSILRLRFGAKETVQSLNCTFYSRCQLEGETFEEFSRSLIRLYDRMELASMDSEERQALGQLKQRALKEQMIRGTRDLLTKRELRRLAHEEPNLPVYQFREQALYILRDVHADDSTVVSCKGVCPSSSGDVVPIDRVAPTKPPGKTAHCTSDGELLRGLVESQKQLCSTMERIMQQQTETNANIQKLSEVIANQRANPAPQNNFQKRKNQVQCSYCKKKGHTSESCFKREYDLKRGTDGTKAEAEPSAQGLVAEVHTSENLTPPS